MTKKPVKPKKNLHKKIAKYEFDLFLDDHGPAIIGERKNHPKIQESHWQKKAFFIRKGSSL